MTSRALSTLIKPIRLIKYANIEKSQLFRPSGRLFINPRPGPFQIWKIQAMSTDVDKVLNDPKRQLDYKQLIERKDKENVIIIDVREHSEIKETGKIPGSIHIPLAELQKALGEMSEEEFKKNYGTLKPSKEAELIFSCKAGGRSVKAFKLALELGYKNAQNYKGGWLDWEKNTQST